MSEEEKSQLEGAKQLDEVLDRPVEVKPAQFIADDEISDSKFRGVTPEMIEEGEKTALVCAERLGIAKVITAGMKEVTDQCRLVTPCMEINRLMVPEWMEEHE